MISKLQHKRNRPSIALSEWLVVTFASLTLGFTAWGFAGVIVWTVHIMLLGGVLTLISAVFPLRNSSKIKDDMGNGLTRLLRWLPFWISLFFLLYMGIQALNPSMTVVRGDGGWWVEKMNSPLADWLPSSVRSDYEPMNAFRVLEWFLASFFLMWGIWAGITRRVTVLIILWSLVISGSVMGLIAVVQHLAEAEKVLWTLQSANEKFWGSFFYRNQGAAYLNLILIAIGFLYFYHAKKSQDRGRSGGPHFLLFLVFALVFFSVAMALSRGGILFGAILSICFLAGVVVNALTHTFRVGLSIPIATIVLSLFGGGGYLLSQQVDLDAIQERFGEVDATIQNADQDARTLSSKATWDMIQDQSLLGWGAGSFRYIFPIYQSKYPTLFYAYHHPRNGWGGRNVYHYAHNDIFQFWAEYGVIGCGLLILTFTSLLFSMVANIWHSPFSVVFLLIGIVSITAHAFIDFILNSPAYWVAFVGLMSASAKLSSLEGSRFQSAR
ncbi:MAG: O-antigen ligase family protein [Opitutaceae bacterium]